MLDIQLGTSGGGNPDGSSDQQADGDVNPYGCYGQTDDPHASRTSGYTDIAVKARTVCPNGPVMDVIGVDIILMKGRICVFGQCLFWDPYSDISYYHKEDATGVDGVAAGAPCENGMYKGESLHWMVDPVGDVYIIETDEKNEVTNCPS